MHDSFPSVHGEDGHGGNLESYTLDKKLQAKITYCIQNQTLSANLADLPIV